MQLRTLKKLDFHTSRNSQPDPDPLAELAT
jgi:hypothetical protein